MDEEQRIKEVYTKYKIKDFFDWWSDNTNTWMEIRTIDWTIAHDIGLKCDVYYSHTGVFVNNVEQLKKVIAYARDKTVLWYGVNPRKWGITKWGRKGISGGDNFVDTIKFIFIDIDRKVKVQPATNNELKDCNIIADRILDRIGEYGFNKNYVKICSGNGLQILIKLDYSIKVPEVEYVKTDKVYSYVTSPEFDKTKQIVYEGFGKHMIKFANRIKKELGIENVEMDKAGFRMAQVGALPVTKNYKFGGFRWRGIVHIENGVNVGLSDYILNITDKEVVKHYKPIFGGEKRVMSESRLIEGKLEQNPIIQLMLTDLPQGQRNNYLWFPIKCLLRDYKINLRGKEFIELHRRLEAKNGPLTLNLPDKKYVFDERTVNRFCIDNLIPPVYKVYPERKIRFNSKIDGLTLDNTKLITEILELREDSTIESDMQSAQDMMIEGDSNNMTVASKFLNGCIKKYGLDATKYYLQYLFPSFFNTRR